ncbi:hypothetical protein CFP56_020300 [Quercus suber]|uniref:Uncharacterized protein n=1 Tax=Quercus suber TaxID=58331 RepID=A0AAW0KHM0_QUESU
MVMHMTPFKRRAANNISQNASLLSHPPPPLFFSATSDWQEHHGLKLQPLPHAPPFPSPPTSSPPRTTDSTTHLFKAPIFFFQWVLSNPSSSEINECGLGKIPEEMFERTMDMFEKAAYTQQLILLCFIQPPLWERYQQQVKEWELALNKNNTNIPNGCQEKAAQIEKLPMFAFCLKPQGLEVPNKGSKQRSRRKFSVSGQSNAILGDQDGFHAFGRRLNGFAFADDKFVYLGHSHSYESHEFSH